MDPLTSTLLAHTQEVCQRVIPLMEQSVLHTTSSMLQYGPYTYTITLSKQATVLGKRKSQQPETDERSQRVWHPPSHAPSEWEPKPMTEPRLFNSMGHNFCPSIPHHEPIPRAASPSYIS
jgi:hypothetical protein